MSKKTTRSNKPFKHLISDETRKHARAARKEIRKSMKALIPSEFVTHRRKARKQVFMAWRSVLDSAIERTEEREKGKE